jgi:cytochrome b
MAASEHRSIRVWDLPTRLFHWLLAAAVAGAFIAIKAGDLVWHARCGQAVLTLLLFRLIWGFIGGRYARFTQFVRGPSAIRDYLRKGSATPGHNPLGALSVIALLAVLLFQAGSGLFANDDIAFEGPLARFVSNALSSALTTWHRRNEVIILGLLALHVGAIVFYRFVRGKNLVGPMIHGDSKLQSHAAPTGGAAHEPSRDDAGLWIRAVVVLAVCALAVQALVGAA